jgi:bifunctional oligoribonuclease and PAP phosphatase NrnA
MQDIQKIKELLSQPKRILITTHHKPDGDALGSSLGLYHFLLKQGHDVVVVSPSDYPVFLHWMPGNIAVINFMEEKEKALKLLANSEVIFCLDLNSLARLHELGDHVKNSPAIKIMIDHHLEPEGFDDHRIWNPDAAATCELVYDFIDLSGGSHLIDKVIATCLYTGILTDTGSFKYSATTAKIHRIAANLLEKGVDNSKIHDFIFDTSSENRLRFTGYCITNKMMVNQELKTAYISVAAAELEKYGIKTGDTEGLVNYPLSIGGIVFVALIIERGDVVKLSFRSKGEFPANEVAKKYFEGGGHLNAAGGRSELSLEETVQKFISVLPEYKELLVKI